MSEKYGLKDKIVPMMDQYRPDPGFVPDPNDLLIFAQVAELGSFSRAADRLGLPKSTVSRRLSALEQGLGERLLWRTTRRQTLTEFGQLLLDHARQVAAEVQAVAALSAQRSAVPSGRLRVSMPSDLATLLLAAPMADFMKRYPAIALDVDLSQRRVDLLGEGFDAAVRIGPLQDDGLLAAHGLRPLRSGLYASPDHVRRHGLPQHPDDLLSQPAVGLLGPRVATAPWVLLRGTERWEGLPPARVSANSPEMMIRLAALGAGVAAVPDLLARAEAQRSALVRVLPDWSLPPEPAAVVFPGRKLMPPKTRVFIDMVRAAFDADGA